MARLFTDVSASIADTYFAHAAALARRARGRAWPNPIVGCVIVRDGTIVGEGFHPRAGQAHAEVFALADAGAQAHGATAYVTLEPCAHHAKTPPCTDALIAAGISRVNVGMADPNPEAAGGADKLSAAGIKVTFAEDPRPFAALNSGWFKRLASGRPLVTVKSGLSLDAQVAFAPGERAAITGPHGAEVTRRLRSRADAVLVSAATVLADDPALTIRDKHGARAEHQPLRVVLARTTLPHEDARVFTDGAAPTLLLASDLADDDALASVPDRVQVVRWSESGGLDAALHALGGHGIGELLVEPGPRLLTALWEADLIDEYVTVTAGGMAGAGVPLFIGDGDREGEALRSPMKALEAGIVGDVSVTTWSAQARLGDE